MPAAENSASSFTIRELSGQERTLQLQGRALPYRPFTLAGDQRLESTNYPGSPETSVQVFGASEGESSLSGMWKEKYIGQAADGSSGSGGTTSPAVLNGEQITSTFELVQTVDSIRRQGQVVEVTWDRIVRIGILGMLEQSWDTVQDCRWTIKFVWISQGDEPRPSDQPQNNDLSNFNSTTRQETTQLQETTQPGFPSSPETVQERTEAVDAVSSAQADLTATVSNNTTGVVAPENAQRRALGNTQALVSTSRNVVSLAQRNPPRTLFYTPTNNPATLTPGQVLQAELYNRNFLRRARRISYLSAYQQDFLRARLASDIIATYTTRAGDDLRTVSRRMYGTPNEWRRILVFNQLPSPELSAGMRLLIPKILNPGS